ncbi:carbon-nitrogen hydrolase family protein [Castellaniella sp. GW247-6E4]|uniref:carbon-nitrogen hydrolase family protein n=1 Tax=Castellaniella sp. GW247-6E4 TaxID=3140380 RepID=UPI003316188D
MNEEDRRFAVAAVQMVSGFAVEANLERADALIARAAAGGARLVALPEYFCLMGRRDTDKIDAAERPGRGPIQEFLAAQARRHGIWLLGGTLPLQSPDAGRIYNACLVFGPDGEVCMRYDKIHLFGFRREAESYDESATIRPGENAPPVFESPFGRVGLGICYDLRFPEFFRAQGDVRLMVLPAAFTYTTGSVHWEVLLRARAIENQCYVLASAQGGKHESGRRTWGHSMLIDPWGEILECLPEGEGVVAGVLEARRLEQVRESLPALRHRVM